MQSVTENRTVKIFLFFNTVSPLNYRGVFLQHDHKDAILNCVEIDYEEYAILQKITDNDPYLKCKNIQEQRNECDGIEDEVQYMKEDEIDYEERAQRRRERIDFQKKKYKAFGAYCYKSATRLVANAY